MEILNRSLSHHHNQAPLKGPSTPSKASSSIEEMPRSALQEGAQQSGFGEEVPTDEDEEEEEEEEEEETVLGKDRGLPKQVDAKLKKAKHLLVPQKGSLRDAKEKRVLSSMTSPMVLARRDDIGSEDEDEEDDEETSIHLDGSGHSQSSTTSNSMMGESSAASKNHHHHRQQQQQQPQQKAGWNQRGSQMATSMPPPAATMRVPREDAQDISTGRDPQVKESTLEQPLVWSGFLKVASFLQAFFGAFEAIDVVMVTMCVENGGILIRETNAVASAACHFFLPMDTCIYDTSRCAFINTDSEVQFDPNETIYNGKRPIVFSLRLSELKKVISGCSAQFIDMFQRVGDREDEEFYLSLYEEYRDRVIATLPILNKENAIQSVDNMIEGFDKTWSFKFAASELGEYLKNIHSIGHSSTEVQVVSISVLKSKAGRLNAGNMNHASLSSSPISEKVVRLSTTNSQTTVAVHIPACNLLNPFVNPPVASNMGIVSSDRFPEVNHSSLEEEVSLDIQLSYLYNLVRKLPRNAHVELKIYADTSGKLSHHLSLNVTNIEGQGDTGRFFAVIVERVKLDM